MLKSCFLLVLLCAYATGQAHLRRLVYPTAAIGSDNYVMKQPTSATSSLLKSGYLEFSNPLWHLMSRAGDYFQRNGRSPRGMKSYISSIPPMMYKDFPFFNKWKPSMAQNENEK